jgi:16S rRNA (guanine966-N2)-methyltransferase
MPEQSAKLRIIAGKFRGRKVFFAADNVQLRPTPDRVRETLFNWLAYSIVDSNCLDLFAGSGVLGLEALSRGAKFNLAVERDHSTYQGIINNRANFGLSDQDLAVIEQDAIVFLQQAYDLRDHKQFDIIFLDPPYNNGNYALLSQILGLILQHNYLALGGKIYFECDDQNYIVAEQLFSQQLKIIKSSRAGKVYFYLAERVT